jgi:hypothetical protein
MSDTLRILSAGKQGPSGPPGGAGGEGPAGPGVPVGGTAGQVLEKSSGVDFATAWVSKVTAAGVTSIDVTADDELEIVKGGITYCLPLYRRLVEIGLGGFAIVGDSISEQGAVGLSQLTGSGFWCFARVHNQAQWQPAVNGAVREFASGGGTTALILATHIPQVVASAASGMIEMSGVNDGPQGLTLAETVANRRAMWAAARAAGVYVIACAIMPIPLSNDDNAAGEYSADMALRNAALKAAAEEDKVPWFDGNHLIEETPGTMILAEENSNDHLHPNRRNAALYGRGMGAFIAARCSFAYDPTANTNWLTPNVVMAGAAGQPTGWGPPYSPPDAGALTKALVDGGDYDWWEIEFNQGTATQQFAITNISAHLGGSAVGKVVETILEFQVISGAVEVLLTQNVAGTGTGLAYDLLGGGASPWADFVPEDGMRRLLTPAVAIGAGATLVYPSVTFRTAPNSTAKIRFRRCGCREVI